MQRGRTPHRRIQKSGHSRQPRHDEMGSWRHHGNSPLPRERSDSESTNEKGLTKWSYYHDGDVEVPEICVYSIDNRCSYEDRGCLRLHAKCASQWQIMHRSNWCNLRNFHSKEIEDAFEDVTRDGVQLSPVNPTKLGNAGKDMFKILGNGQWEADFETMRLESKGPLGTGHKMRRLSTQSSALSKSSKATTYEWHFLDGNKKWIKYGERDSAGESHISSITSEEIEKNYNIDRSAPLNFSASKFQYLLDMESMEQTNTTTNKVRPVRRRPVKKVSTRVSKHDTSNANTATSNQYPVNQDLPTFWDAMKTTDTMVVVSLEASSQEFRDIAGMLLLTMPNRRPVSIKRVQNPFLWRPFKNKQNELSLRYGGDKKLNIQRLFHGTREEHVDLICKENFDWRLHGTNVGQVYGRGSYFSNSAAFASKYCSPSLSGHSFFLVAEVIVGQITKGNGTMTRPPKNPSTNELYDTTVDNAVTPKIFVKYDKQEYCPLYVVEYV